MPSYKLHYFNLRGRAELARLILAYGNIQYEDYRIERSEWPGEHKAKYTFGQLPVLEVDGKFVTQSHTIARYFARKSGIAGKDELEQAQADSYVDCIADLWTSLVPAFLEQDPEKQKEMWNAYVNEQLVPHAQIIEKHLKKNGSGFLVGTAMTWADLAYYSFYTAMLARFPDILKDLPHFKRLLGTVENVPQIKKWIDTRPKTDL